MPISNSRLQFLLSQSLVFQGRLQIILSTVAGVVLNEASDIDAHEQRAQYARHVLANPAHAAQVSAGFIAQSTNVANTITMEDEGPRTSVDDAALFGQITALWDQLAGVS